MGAAAKSAIDAKKASAPAQEVTKTVVHDKNGVVTTTVTKHMYTKPPTNAAVIHHHAAIKAAKAAEVLANPTVAKELKVLEDMAVKKHHLDRALVAKENAIIAKAKKDAASDSSKAKGSDNSVGFIKKGEVEQLRRGR